MRLFISLRARSWSSGLTIRSWKWGRRDSHTKNPTGSRLRVTCHLLTQVLVVLHQRVIFVHDRLGPVEELGILGPDGIGCSLELILLELEGFCGPDQLLVFLLQAVCTRPLRTKLLLVLL